MFSEIKRQLKPSKGTEEKIKGIKEEIIQRLKEEGYKATPAGSTARGTYLPEKPDIDIFFYFSPDTKREKLEKEGIKIGKKILKNNKPTTHYAEHPYVKAEVKGIDIDLVPCYEVKEYKDNKEELKIEGELLSAVDRTPLHNQYLKENIKDEQKIEVKLLKKFLKNIGCYGADEKTRGFSGYTTELLILKYNTFEETLKAASKWKRNQEIDIEKHGEKEFKDPLVIIDPIDPKRNAAAAISEETLGRFIVKSRKLLKNPTKEQFKSKIKINREKIKEKNLILIEMPYPEETVPETAWSQLRKLEKQVTKKLSQDEFKVYRSAHWTDENTKTQILLEIRNKELPKYRRHMGPPFYNKEHSKRFMEKEENQEIHIQGERLYALKKRKHRKIKEKIKSILKSEEIPSRYQKPVKKTEVTEGIEKIIEQKGILKRYLQI
ncbi:MAG: CCA tRNA nucleotidyltransferase [archaeon]